LFLFESFFKNLLEEFRFLGLKINHRLWRHFSGPGILRGNYMTNITTLLPGQTTTGSEATSLSQNLAGAGHFLDAINNVLNNVSDLQGSAATAEATVAAGLPGASLGKALVGSDRAEVAWTATVAVRNEIVSAYQSIMNMQF
jgi:flagellar hook-basal body complex protein FliE